MKSCSGRVRLAYIFGHYFIEGGKVSEIGQVAGGELNGEYRFVTPGEEVQPDQYYRLKAIDLDGGVHTSQIVVLRGPGTGAQVQVYPSFIQAGGSVRLEVSGEPGQAVSWSLIDMTGKTVEQGRWSLENAYEQKMITPTVEQAGAYVLQVNVEGEVENFRVLVR